MPFEKPLHPLLLSLNENPLAPSSKVASALSKAVSCLNRYPVHGKGLEATIASYLGQGLTEDNITVGHGGTEILQRVATSYIGAGDEAVIPVPTFPLYAINVANRGGIPVLTECNDDFSVDVESLLRQVTPKTRLMFVTSPNNPSGTVMHQEELDFLITRLPEHVFLVFDEVYWHFGVHPVRARAYRHLERKNLLILHSFSKAFGLAGLRLGYGITNSAVATEFASPNTSLWHNRLLTAAGVAALQDNEHVCRAVELVRSQRNCLFEGLVAQKGIGQVLPSEASFVTFKPEVSSAWLVQQLAERNIQVRDLETFYMPGWVRVSVGLPSANECFLAALQDVLT